MTSDDDPGDTAVWFMVLLGGSMLLAYAAIIASLRFLHRVWILLLIPWAVLSGCGAITETHRELLWQARGAAESALPGVQDRPEVVQALSDVRDDVGAVLVDVGVPESKAPYRPETSKALRHQATEERAREPEILGPLSGWLGMVIPGAGALLTLGWGFLRHRAARAAEGTLCQVEEDLFENRTVDARKTLSESRHPRKRKKPHA